MRFRNKKYGFLFQYGFNGLDSFDEDFKGTKEVYRRRIARLEERLRSDASILFVRLHSNPEDAEKIASTLTREYPNLDFTLLALDNTEENRKDWGIPRVISRYIDCAPMHDATNRKYDRNWKKVLGEFKVRTGPDSPSKRRFRGEQISPLD